MSLRIVFEQAKEVASGIWQAPIPPSELTRLGPSLAAGSGRSVIVVSAPPSYDADGATLSISSSALFVAHQGDPETAEVIVVSTIDPQAKEAHVETPRHETQLVSAESSQHTAEPRTGDGDRAFLKTLSRDLPLLSVAGRQLLQGVRQFYPSGSLQQAGGRREFVETPENFWTVTVQPAKRELLVSVYGNPTILLPPSDIILKAGRTYSYRRFRISRDTQVEGALGIIRRAFQAKMSKRRRRL